MWNTQLETRRIGKIGFDPAVLSLGCWSFGGSFWGGQDDDSSADAIQTALGLGINHFDTAQGYGGGRSESVCGQHLADRRTQVFLATKAGARPKDQILQAVDASLQRLGTDYIDLFYIHWPRKNFDLRQTMEGLAEARAAGKIRGIGVSNFTIEQMQQVLEVGTPDAHQLCYNLFWRHLEADIIPFCVQNHIAVVTYSSIALGILTGKFPRKPQFPAGDDRGGTVFFDEDVWPHVYNGIEQLEQIAGELNRPLAHLAIRWVATRPGVTSVLVGARDGDQVRQNVAAMAGHIPPDALDRATAISDQVCQKIPDTGNIFRYYP